MGLWCSGQVPQTPSLLSPLPPSPALSAAQLASQNTGLGEGGPLLGALVCGLGGLESIAHAFPCMGLGVSEGEGRGPAPWGWAVAK